MNAITILGVAVAIILMLFAIYRLIDRVFLSEERPALVGAQEALARIDALSARRALLLRELKDIEFDHETGKIDDADFRRLRKRYRSEWLKVDRELEALTGDQARYLAHVDDELDRRLESRSVGEQDRRRRRDRVICRQCGAANPTHLTECAECEQALDAADLLAARASASDKGAAPGAQTP